MRSCSSFLVALVFAGLAAGAQEKSGTTAAGSVGAADSATATAVETVVFLRHGEKPATGLGQLTPKGLNRALALSDMLPRKFGKPDYLFAPDPREKVNDKAGLCYYVRPLATIEPTAIRLGMAVQTPCGFRDTDELIDELGKSEYHRAVIFVAWEHVYERKAVADLFKRFGGDPSQVPQWADGDYDSLYVVTIHRPAGGTPSAVFKLDHEGLDGQSSSMPEPAKPQ